MGTRPRISLLAAALADKGFKGQVCGVFRQGINISAGEGKILYLGSFEKPLSCIGVQLPAAWMARILALADAGDSVVAEKMKLVFARNQQMYLAIDLASSETVDLALSAPVTSGARGRLQKALADADLCEGIGLDRDAALECVIEDLSWFAAGKRTDPVAAISWLIGRGLGLTPAGDDILCGFGAGLAAAGEQELHDRFLAELAKARRKRHTTAVSEAYLDAMAQGSVNEGICMLLAAAEADCDLTEPLRRARAYGHTSGADMLFGLLLGLGGAPLRA